MEYKKTKRDTDQEKSDYLNNPVVIYLLHKDNWQFNVGDILVRQWKDSEGGWRTEKYNDVVPRKYLYAFENSVGIGYLKAFNADGKLSEVPVCVTEFLTDNQRFILDPDYADHLMIGEGDYDPLVLQREKKNFRNKMMGKNRKQLIPLNSPAEILAWTKTLQVGDTFYCGYGIADMIEKKYEVVNIKADAKVMHIQPSYTQENIKKMFNLASSDTFPIIKVKPIKHPYSKQQEEWTAYDFQRRYVMTKEPFPLTEKI